MQMALLRGYYEMTIMSSMMNDEIKKEEEHKEVESGEEIGLINNLSLLQLGRNLDRFRSCWWLIYWCKPPHTNHTTCWN